jgi:hypothetical protein
MMSRIPERIIAAHIYDQEGILQPFNMKDKQFNRAFAEWLRVHDRSQNALPPLVEKLGLLDRLKSKWRSLLNWHRIFWAQHITQKEAYDG